MVYWVPNPGEKGKTAWETHFFLKRGILYWKQNLYFSLLYPPCGPREVDRADIFPEQKEGSKGSIISDSFMPCSVYVCRHTIMECLMYVQTVLRIRIFWPSDPFILSIRNRIRIFNIIIICFSCEISYSWAITWKITLIFSPVEGIFPFFSVDFSQSYFFPLTPI